MFIEPNTRFPQIKIRDYVDINPLERHPGWRPGQIRRVDKYSGQCQIVYKQEEDEFLYWAHLNNPEEIAPFMTKSAKTIAKQQVAAPQKNISRNLFIKYFQQRHEIDELFKDCSLETNIWNNNEYNDLFDKFGLNRNNLSISAMIEIQEKKMNSFMKRCKKGIQTIWNSFRRSMSVLDLFTDIRLLYLMSIADDPILSFIIILSVSLVCPYIVSYSCGVKLFHINRDNNYDIKNFTQTNSFDGYVALKKIIAYLSLSPIGVFYFLLLDLIDILFVYYKLFAVIFFGKNEMEVKLLEEMVAKQLGMSRMDYEGIKRQRATAQLSLVTSCFSFVLFRVCAVAVMFCFGA